MPKVVVVLGLCGSGKSHVSRELAARGFATFDEGVVPGYPNWEPFLAALSAGKDCVVAEIAFYSAENRAGFEAMLAAQVGTTVEYVCFENDSATADANCRKDVARGKRDAVACEQNIAQNAGTLARFASGDYSFPENAEHRPIVAAV